MNNKLNLTLLALDQSILREDGLFIHIPVSKQTKTFRTDISQNLIKCPRVFHIIISMTINIIFLQHQVYK